MSKPEMNCKYGNCIKQKKDINELCEVCLNFVYENYTEYPMEKEEDKP